jgi:hypothetical protein
MMWQHPTPEIPLCHRFLASLRGPRVPQANLSRKKLKKIRHPSLKDDGRVNACGIVHPKCPNKT